jgi:hypothetical protein
MKIFNWHIIHDNELKRLRERDGRKKAPVSYTLRPCLGYCGGMHKSTDDGDRVCPKCKERQRLAMQYIPNHSVYIEGNGRV